eukprot:Lithocolla_globosa_v1_NODE_732_length_3370_cov_317.275935.p3 type:complete len:129 gc:universal NODE_732_length_3370_cov_317.275935:438-52(-)
MNPRDIETYTTEVIDAGIPADQSSFTRDIYLDFQPDDIILKAITTPSIDGSVPSNLNMFFIRSNLIDNGTLASIPVTDKYHETYNNVYKNNKQINGTYSFNLYDVDDDPFSYDDLFTVAITLTFVKWK